MIMLRSSNSTCICPNIWIIDYKVINYLKEYHGVYKMYCGSLLRSIEYHEKSEVVVRTHGRNYEFCANETSRFAWRKSIPILSAYRATVIFSFPSSLSIHRLCILSHFPCLCSPVLQRSLGDIRVDFVWYTRDMLLTIRIFKQRQMRHLKI
jgi:hypothetical protein